MNVNPCQIPSFSADVKLANPEPARVKVLNPMITTGPAMHSLLLDVSANRLHLRVPRLIVVGSAVQVVSGKRVAFGLVCTCISAGSEFEIGVEMERSA
jgi:hypothetical protein